jgi:Protein of unknown function (DUF3180)
MKPTRISTLVATAVVVTLVSLMLLRSLRAAGHTLPPVPWTAGVGLLLVGALVYAAAVPVRRLTHGSPRATPIDPLRAARTAVLGKATAYAGAVILGWYLGQVLLYAPDLDIDARRSQAIRAGLTALAALVTCVAGLLAERMCRVPPPDDRAPQVGGRPDQRGDDGDDGDVSVAHEAKRHD